MEKEKTYHFIGIGGIGMSALARYLKQMSASVKGSDSKPSYITEAMQKEGIKINIGHDQKNIGADDVVIYSSAIKKNNCEYEKALKNQNKLLHRADFLRELMQGYQQVLVAGTHGKTTTSSLLAHVLKSVDCSFLVGGIIKNYQSNAFQGKGRFFVAETDESDGSFLKTDPYAAIVTNLEKEHLDHWKDMPSLINGFKQFIAKVDKKELLFWCIEDENLKRLQIFGTSYGFSKEADLYAENIRYLEFQTVFDISFEGKKYANVRVNLAGEMNVLNALAVFGLALRLGIFEENIRKAFQSFHGVKRRMDRILTKQTVTFIDDYAHHPTEIKKTLAALRKAVLEKRIIAIFQPHRYSRLKELLDEFVLAFDDADLIIVLDVYSAGETFQGVDHNDFLKQMRKSKKRAIYLPKNELSRFLKKEINFFDVVIGLGAGSISSMMDKIGQDFAKRDKKMKVGLFLGGQSCEHEVSILSAASVFETLDKSLYEVKLFGITKEGGWIVKENVLQRLRENEAGERLNAAMMKEMRKCDIALPVLHGPFGEDGMIQGFFETLHIPYVGCDYFACAVAMNKAWSKYIAKESGIAVAPYVYFTEVEWKEDALQCLRKAKERLFPLYVKPVHLGSSVAISFCQNEEEVIKAIKLVFQHDSEVLIEEMVKGKEVQFAVYGNDSVKVATPGEILDAGTFHDYKRKYQMGKPMSKTPAELPEESVKLGKGLAKKIYVALAACGFMRLDFFYTDDGKFIFNEANPIPGMTKTSLFPNALQQSGISFSDFINHSIMLGLHKTRKTKKMVFSYNEV